MNRRILSILTQIKKTAGVAFGSLGEGLFPQDCLSCGAASGKRLLCPACEADLPALRSPCCQRCALPIPDGKICGRCLVHPPHFDRAVAVYAYAFPLDKLLQAFKYGHRLALGPYFGRQMTAAAATMTADLLLPLPLHTRRLRERGFNQALELARPIGELLRRPIDTASCRRAVARSPQASLPLRERAKNVRGVFSCTTDFAGKRILLIDDVMTTGASLDECARLLKRHGAAEVAALVLARALP